MLWVNAGESISLDNGNIVVHVDRIKGDPKQVRLSINAPPDVHIGRPYNRLKPPKEESSALRPPSFTKPKKPDIQ